MCRTPTRWMWELARKVDQACGWGEVVAAGPDGLHLGNTCHRSKTWGDAGADGASQYTHAGGHPRRARGPYLPYLSIEHPHRPDHGHLPGHSCPLSFFLSPPGPLCSAGWGQRLEVGWAWVLGTESQLGLQAWSRHKAARSLGLAPAQHPDTSLSSSLPLCHLLHVPLTSLGF